MFGWEGRRGDGRKAGGCVAVGVCGEVALSRYKFTNISCMCAKWCVYVVPRSSTLPECCIVLPTPFWQLEP